jgi:hypothetical protein
MSNRQVPPLVYIIYIGDTLNLYRDCWFIYVMVSWHDTYINNFLLDFSKPDLYTLVQIFCRSFSWQETNRDPGITPVSNVTSDNIRPLIGHHAFLDHLHLSTYNNQSGSLLCNSKAIKFALRSSIICGCSKCYSLFDWLIQVTWHEYDAAIGYIRHKNIGIAKKYLDAHFFDYDIFMSCSQ